MRLTSLKLSNFRSYRGTTEIRFDDLTAFIGKNDIGKSTILEALDIFFNDGSGAVKMDSRDVNTLAARDGDDDIVIAVCFSDLPESITIDATYETSFADEYMLNENGEFEIEKHYKAGGKAKVYIRAIHPTRTECSDLLTKKNAELKAIVNTQHIECENQAINKILRQAIWNHYSDSLQPASILIDASKEDAKKLWDKIRQLLPVYSLFQADRKNSDNDSEVQDPLKIAVREILSDPAMQATLSEISRQVAQRLTEVATRTLAKLQEMDAGIAQSLMPTIPSGTDLRREDVFKKVSISGDEGIPINKRGSGVKRLVLLNFFRAEAERKAEAEGSTGIIYAIEEPETSQHWNNQMMLIESLKTLSEMAGIQIIITTHSSEIVKRLRYSNLRLISSTDEDTRIVMDVQPNVLQYPSLNEVNYYAFGLLSAEYHNELYGFIDSHQLHNDYIQGKTQFSYTYDDHGNPGRVVRLCKTDIIRHQIHHPENPHNQQYTQQELQDSIESMRAFIRNRMERDGLWDPIE